MRFGAPGESVRRSVHGHQWAWRRADRTGASPVAAAVSTWGDVHSVRHSSIDNEIEAPSPVRSRRYRAARIDDSAYMPAQMSATENPTLDRVAETVARLREDVTSKLHRPDGRRQAIVRVGEPIDLRKHLDSFTKGARSAVRELTATCEAAAQSGIDHINSSNSHAGAAAF